MEAITISESVLSDRRLGWAAWREAMAAASREGGDKGTIGLTWRFMHSVPVYLQCGSFHLRLRSAWGALEFSSGQCHAGPGLARDDFPEGAADMSLTHFRAAVVKLLDLSEQSARQLVLQTQDGALLTDDDLVTCDAQGESDSSED